MHKCIHVCIYVLLLTICVLKSIHARVVYVFIYVSIYAFFFCTVLFYILIDSHMVNVLNHPEMYSYLSDFARSHGVARFPGASGIFQ